MSATRWESKRFSTGRIVKEYVRKLKTNVVGRLSAKVAHNCTSLVERTAVCRKRSAKVIPPKLQIPLSQLKTVKVKL